MPIRQLSIFLENRQGRLEFIMRILGDSSINIRGLSIADTAEFGILRLIVENTDHAINVLDKAGVASHLGEVTAVLLANQPGSLAALLTLMNAQQENIEYMYTLAANKLSEPVLIIRFTTPKSARATLANSGYHLLNEADLSL